MYADLEELVLSGKIFNGESRSSSPVRSPSSSRSVSPAPQHTAHWPELDEDGSADYDSDEERSKRIEQILRTSASDGPGPGEQIGMGPGRTGVKGVLRDRAEAQNRARIRRVQEVDALNLKMERAALVGSRTALDDEREAQWERMMLEGLDPVAELAGSMDVAPGKMKGRFGHLREVGVDGFVAAVEREARGVWVVVHIYDPSLDRCYSLDAILSRLAPLNSDVKFLRTRAGALGFARLSSTSTSRSPLSSAFRTGSKSAIQRFRSSDEDDDPYADDPNDDENDFEGEDDDDVDLDMLPTLLVYRDGELVYNWVRVDWEAGRQGVEELLRKHRILQQGSLAGNCGLPSDDDEDLLFNSDVEDPS